MNRIDHLMNIEYYLFNSLFKLKLDSLYQIKNSVQLNYN